MRVLFDTNVVLDVLLDRQPWVIKSQELWQAHDDYRITGYLVASTLTDIFYVIRRAAGFDKAEQAVDLCLQTFEICPVHRAILKQAQALAGRDFEDNVQIACAITTGLDAIVTRNPKGFKHSSVPVLSPQELLNNLPS